MDSEKSIQKVNVTAETDHVTVTAEADGEASPEEIEAAFDEAKADMLRVLRGDDDLPY